MTLISEIIDTLGTQGRSLTAGLLKTRALLRQSGNSELVAWADCELLGYRNRNSVPIYRRLPADVFANIEDPTSQIAAYPISVLHLPAEQRDSLACIHLTEAVGALEELSTTTEDRFAIPMATQSYQLLTALLPKDARIERAWNQCDRQHIVEVLAAIRSRLLGCMCELQDRVQATEEADLAASLAALDMRGLFEKAMFAARVDG